MHVYLLISAKKETFPYFYYLVFLNQIFYILQIFVSYFFYLMPSKIDTIFAGLSIFDEFTIFVMSI